MLQLEIVTPEKKIFSDTVIDVYLPGADGEMGVLELHAALITALQPGELRYQKDGETHALAIGSGFAEVTQEKVSVLTDSAFGDAEIDEAAEEAAPAMGFPKYLGRIREGGAGTPLFLVHGGDEDIGTGYEVQGGIHLLAFSPNFL